MDLDKAVIILKGETTLKPSTEMKNSERKENLPHCKTSLQDVTALLTVDLTTRDGTTTFGHRQHDCTASPS